MTDKQTMPPSIVLSLQCDDKPGIVASVADFLFKQGMNIIDSAQHGDEASDRFFLRVQFRPVGHAVDVAHLDQAFRGIAATYDMAWSFNPTSERKRVAIMVSRFDHCLVDLIYRCRIGELPIDVTAVISNHPRDDTTRLDLGDIPFHYLPIQKDEKGAQERCVLAIIENTNTNLVVLARYMQVLSDFMAEKLAGRAINIHHSFLPGFKGAKPYHQAHKRGVKIIGATAHYVTADLDEGPIIEQDVERISHADSPDEMIRKGRDIERRVLARAVRLHVENRVFINRNRTVVL